MILRNRKSSKKNEENYSEQLRVVRHSVGIILLHYLGGLFRKNDLETLCLFIFLCVFWFPKCLHWEMKSSYRNRLEGFFFFQNCSAPLVHKIFLAKISKIIHTSDSFAHKNFPADPLLVREFRFPVIPSYRRRIRTRQILRMPLENFYRVPRLAPPLEFCGQKNLWTSRFRLPKNSAKPLGSVFRHEKGTQT